MTIYDPQAVAGVLTEYGLNVQLLLSPEPDIDAHVILLDAGLELSFHGSAMQLTQDVDGQILVRGEYTTLAEITDAVRDYLEMAL